MKNVRFNCFVGCAWGFLAFIFVSFLSFAFSAHAENVSMKCAGKFAHPKEFCDARSLGSIAVISNISKNGFDFYCYSKDGKNVAQSYCVGNGVGAAVHPKFDLQGQIKQAAARRSSLLLRGQQ